VDEAAERRNIYVSDRRWKNIVRLLRTSAFMQDREEVDICDLLPIYHCLWQEPEERDAIRSIVIRALFSPFAEKLVEMKNALAEDIKYHRVRRNPDDGRDYEGEIETLSDGLTFRWKGSWARISLCLRMIRQKFRPISVISIRSWRLPDRIR